MFRPSGDLQAQLEKLLRDGAFNSPRHRLPSAGPHRRLHEPPHRPPECGRPPHPCAVVRSLLADGLLIHHATLTFISPEAACGKTRVLTVTKHLVPHPDHTADLSPASIYHSIETQMNINGGRPTILYDSADGAIVEPALSRIVPWRQTAVFRPLQKAPKASGSARGN